MKINNNYNNWNSPNFKAIRIVDATELDYHCFKRVFSDYCSKNTVFKDKTYNHHLFHTSFKSVANDMGQDMDWQITNAKQFNLLSKTDEVTKTPMIAITGLDKLKLTFQSFKDTFRLRKYYYKALELSKQKKLPEHLVGLKAVRDFADAHIGEFETFLQKNHAKHVSFEDFCDEVVDKKI